jgi:hypothetical protein
LNKSKLDSENSNKKDTKEDKVVIIFPNNKIKVDKSKA